MVIEKGVRYGRTTEEVMKFGFPEDNESNIKVDNEIVLTDDEVRKMFPNQYVVLKVVDCADIDNIGNFRKAVVKYFKCEGHFSVKMSEKLEDENPGEIYFDGNYYDPALEGDLLWF